MDVNILIILSKMLVKSNLIMHIIYITNYNFHKQVLLSRDCYMDMDPSFYKLVHSFPSRKLNTIYETSKSFPLEQDPSAYCCSIEMTTPTLYHNMFEVVLYYYTVYMLNLESISTSSMHS